MIIEDLSNCPKKYSIVYTDHPWQQSRGGKKRARLNSSGLPLTYKTMPLADIEELHRTFLRQCTEEKHNVFMWTIDKYLSEAEAMMKRLGYKLHARIVWDKLNGPSPAFTLRFQTEYLLWFLQTRKYRHAGKRLSREILNHYPGGFDRTQPQATGGI